MDAACPNCNDHYLTSKDDTADYTTWASIVFHDSIDGAPRVLCGNLVVDEVEEDDANKAMNDSSSSTSSPLLSLGATGLMFVAANFVFGTW